MTEICESAKLYVNDEAVDILTGSKNLGIDRTQLLNMFLDLIKH